MNQLNSIILEGNLTKDAELREPKDGFNVCTFSMGVNRWYKNKNDESVEEVSYFDVETYGKMAEYCSKKAVKGRGVRVVGRLKQNVWKDADNKTHSKVYVVAEHIEYRPILQATGEQNSTTTQKTLDKKSEKTNVTNLENLAVQKMYAKESEEQQAVAF